MLDTILFDLDGTLIPLTQQAFIEAYFAELAKVFHRLHLDAERSMQALWAGTMAMIRNDGSMPNARRFWEQFSATMQLTGEPLRRVEQACDRFYANEFDAVKSVLLDGDAALPRRLLDLLSAKGYAVALATNPLFPTCAVTTRLGWIGLSPRDFCLLTDYSNSSYSKPNPDYYREILQTLGKEPAQCLMVGNNAREDMAAAAAGIDTYLVTDYLENEADVDISAYRQGTLAELERYLTALPSRAGR